MKISIGPQTIIQPLPVLIIGSYKKDGTPNLMNAAWGGICCSNPPCVSFSTRKQTLTYESVLERKAFTVGIPSEKYIKEADFVGTVSGKDVDKFAKAKLTAIRSEKVDAPFVDEFPFSLECKLLNTVDLGLHTLFIGEIIDIKAEKDVLAGKENAPDIQKVRPLLWGGFGSNYYYGVGEKLGKAFSVGDSVK